MVSTNGKNWAPVAGAYEFRERSNSAYCIHHDKLVVCGGWQISGGSGLYLNDLWTAELLKPVHYEQAKACLELYP